MLSCSACAQKAPRRLPLSFANIVYRRPLLSAANPSCAGTSRPFVAARGHSTVRSIQQGHHRRELVKSLNLKSKPKRLALKAEVAKGGSARERMAINDAFARANNRQLRLVNNGSTGLSGESTYLNDRVKLAQEVVRLLKAEKVTQALDLVRASESSNNGSSIDSTVSWNHIIDWLMRQHNPKQAWKVFNEMKKRGHKPDALTFTALLQGYRENVYKVKNAVERATEVYNSMYAANSAVKPNIIHTNSVLSVCARGHDMTQIWTIAGRLPERGPGAPDQITYTTILTAITADARKRALELGEQDGDPDAGDNVFEKAVEDGRKLWTDVTARWRRGDLEIDEHLVCAMGRLLMLSKQPHNHQDVFTLVEQTMRLSTQGKSIEDTEKSEIAPEESTEDNVDDLQNGAKDEHESTPPGPLSDQFLNPVNSVFATPGSKTLSMLIETATSLKDIEAGKRYWNIITSPEKPYRVQPDFRAYTDYLRLLRIARSSKETLAILKSFSERMWEKMATKGTFIIAMSTCARDKNNPNVFATASEIIDMMQQKLEQYTRHDGSDSDGSIRELLILSPKVLKNYLQVALATTHGLNGEALVKQKDGDLDFERDLNKNNTTHALTKLVPATNNAKRLLKIFVEEYERQLADKSRTVRVTWLLRKRAEVPEHVAELLEYFQALLGALDKVFYVNEKLEDEGLGPLDGAFLRDITAQKRTINTLVSKVNNIDGIRGAKNSWAPKHTEEEVFGDRVPWSTAKVVNKLSPPSAERGRKATTGDNDAADVTGPIESTERSEISRAVYERRAKRGENANLRGMSRRQRLEVQKEDNIRSKFPETLLRDRSDRRTGRAGQNSRFSESRFGNSSRRSDGGRRLEEGLFEREGSNAETSSRQRRSSGRSSRNSSTRASDGPSIRYTNRAAAEDVRSRPPRSSSERKPVTEGDRRRSAARLRYQVTQGWGTEFGDLAKQQGQGRLAELTDLRS